jgi:hypothetical protein
MNGQYLINGKRFPSTDAYTRTPMVGAIETARRTMEAAGLRPACAGGTVRVLRAKTGA